MSILFKRYLKRASKLYSKYNWAYELDSVNSRTVNASKLLIIRKFIYLSIVFNTVNNIRSINTLLNPRTQKQMILHYFDWIVWITMIVLTLISKLKKRLDLVYPILVVVLIKASVHIIDTQTLNESLENGTSHALVAY